MARKDDDNSAISLFSFQDIITSITGIMFLVVLLLVLIMLTSKKAAPPIEVDENTKNMQQQVIELQNQIKQLKDSSQLLEEELAKIRSMSPEAIAERMTQLQQQIPQLRRKLENTQQQIQADELKLAQLKKSLQLESENIELQQQTFQQQLNKQKKLEAALKSTNESLEQKKKLVQFTISRHNSKNPLLIEADKNGFQLLDTTLNKYMDFRRSASPQASMQALLQYATRYKTANNYFTIIAKPSGFLPAKVLSYELKKAGFERGIEILPEENLSIFEGRRP